jgi:hypothetical protein
MNSLQGKLYYTLFFNVKYKSSIMKVFIECNSQLYIKVCKKLIYINLCNMRDYSNQRLYILTIIKRIPMPCSSGLLPHAGLAVSLFYPGTHTGWLVYYI